MTVDVLGTKYTITESNKVKDDNLNSGDGYCDHSTKQIVIDTFQDSPGSLADLKTYRQLQYMQLIQFVRFYIFS